MILNTGFGILVKNGKKLRKFELTPGEHNFSNEFTVQEVANRAELDAIVLDKSDEQISFEKSMAQRQTLRDSALLKLKGIGITNEELNALFGV